MKQTETEIQRCQEFLSRDNISDSDRLAAERGLNDWFCQSLFDEGLLQVENIIDDYEENYERRDHPR